MGKNIRALLFDFDGVLFDFEPLHFDSWKKVIEELGYSSIPFSIHDVIGVSDYQIAATIIKQMQNVTSLKMLLEKKDRYMMKTIENTSLNMDEIEPILSDLSKKYIMAIVSSSPRKLIEFVLQQTRIDPFFSFIIGAEDSPHHKPDPEPYLLAIDQLGFPSDTIVAIEDSGAGVQSATKANLFVIWYTRHVDKNSHIPHALRCDSFYRLEEVIGFLASNST